MTEKDLYTLITDISRYYPMGLEIAVEKYPGYLKWQEVLASKMSGVQNASESRWREFVRVFQRQNKFANNDPDCSFWQFPSFSLRLDLNRRIENSVERVQTFCVDISLLTKAYTIFHEESIKVTDVFTSLQKGRNPTFIIVSSKTVQSEEYKTIMAIAHQELLQLYPDHQFLEHYALFSHKMTAGAPYHSGLAANGSYKIYDYLFSASYQKEGNVSILL